MIDTSFILLLCFIGFMGIALKLGYRKSLQGLDQQIASISKTMEDALQALKQAEEKQAQELKYHSLIEGEVSEIFKRTHHQIEDIKQQAQIDLEKIIQQRSANAESQIDRLRNGVITELNAHITNQVITAINLLFNQHISKETHQEINEHLLNKLDQIFQKKEPANNGSSAQKKIIKVG